MSSIIVAATISVSWCLMVKELPSQELDVVRQRCIDSLSIVESTPSLKMNVENTNFNTFTSALVYQRGLEMWQEFESHSLTDVEEGKRRSRAFREVMGSDLATTHAFDGRTAYSFSSTRLNLRIQPSDKYPSGGIGTWVLPIGWVSVRPRFSIRAMLEESKAPAKTTLEVLGDGRFKIRQEDSRKHTATEKNQMFMVDREFTIDPQKDYLVTEYKGIGEAGEERTGKLDWQQHEGHWYVKSAEHIDQGKVICKFTISEISFDAKDCRPRFDDLESVVPFATQIEEFDARGKKIKERYKGGDEGKIEYDLRKLALINKNAELRDKK